MTDSLFSFYRNTLAEHQGWVADVIFDCQQELIWAAGQKGVVASYYSTGLSLYTKFQANSDITQILTVEPGILTLSAERLNLHTRTGQRQLSLTSPNMKKLCCMSVSPAKPEVLIGGQYKIMTKYDLQSRKIAGEFAIADDGCVLIKEAPALNCLGSPNGNIYLYDKNSHKQTNVIEAHSGTISDVDISDNMLVSCGFASRGNDLSVKRSLLLYDLRMMRSLNAIHCSIDPLQLKFMPMYHSQVLIASQTGQFQQLEVTSTIPQNNNCFNIDLGGNNCYALDLSSTSKALAIGDTAGVLHLLASQEGTQFNGFSHPTFFPSETVLNFPKPVNIDDITFPFASIPLPLTNEPLLSDWPVEFNRPGDRRPKLVDPEALRNMKMVKYIGYTPNPNNIYKNSIPYDMSVLRRQTESPTKRVEDTVHIPRVYQQVQVDPTVLSDLELRNLNRTKFSVIHTSKRYKYLCPLIQMLYYIEPIALALKAHICQSFNCLACELSILFFNLDNTDDKITDADNFFQIFEQTVDSKSHNMYFSGRHPETKDLLHISQSIVTTLLRILDKEIAPIGGTSPIFLTFGSKVRQVLTCLTCKHSRGKPSINLSYNLVYPNTKASISFLELLKKVMQLEIPRNLPCENCSDYKHVESSILESLPYILHINCGMQSQGDVLFWQQQVANHNSYAKQNACPGGLNCTSIDCNKMHEPTAWLPLYFHIRAGKEQGQLVFKRGKYDEKTDDSEHPGIFEYELYAVIANIDNKSPQDRQYGLLLHTNIGRSYHLKKGIDDRCWYIFNGISATCTSDKECVAFGQTWKTPCIVIYKQVKLPKEITPNTTPNLIDVFTPYNYIPGFNLMPLGLSEVPSKGELVGIGVEVVKDYLVRVVMVRGQGVNEGIPFSHDICPPSLNPEMLQSIQQAMLTPSKILFYKIKCLCDRGIIIVGHNITKQLKCLNVQIPSQQYINSSELFRPHSDSEFYPPMELLCSRLLNVDFISSPENNAFLSLQLYEKFLELKRAGQFEKTLKSLHETN